MHVGCVTPILNVSDIEASLEWFERLGWRTRWTYGTEANEGDRAGFASVGCGAAEIFLCRNGQGSRGGPRPRHPGDDDTGGVWMTWWVQTPAHVDEAHALARELGLDVTRPPADEPWGVREFHLRHPDGHMFRVSAGLSQT